MNKHLFTFILSLFFIVNSSLGFSQTIHEDQLGLENSVELKTVLQETMLDEDGSVDPFKVEKLRDQVIRRRTEELTNMVNLRVLEGDTPEEAKEDALKDSKMLALEFILTNLDSMTNKNSDLENQVIARRVYKIWKSLQRDPNVALLVQIPGILGQLGANQPTVPVKELRRKMPSNLVNVQENRFYTKAELRSMVKAGMDLSTIDPADSAYWKNPGNIASIKVADKIEAEGKVPTIFYFRSVKKTNTNPKIRVYSLNQKGKKVKWKMKFGKEVNSAIAASKLGRLLGYNQDRPYYTRDFKVYFKNEQAFKDMVIDWVSRFNSYDEVLPSKYIKSTGQDENGYYMICHEAVISKPSLGEEKVGPFHKTTMGNYERRELRGQLLYQAFVNNTDYKTAENSKTMLVTNSKNPSDWEIKESNHDVGYSFGALLFNNNPNSYNWSFVKKKRGKVRFYRYKTIHPIKRSESPFLQATYSDIKWLARKMVQITRPQLKEITKLSGWPTVVADLFYEKMISRRNEIVKVFELEGEVINGKTVEIWDQISPRRMNSQYVSKGKLSKKYKPAGYPLNYSPSYFNDQIYLISIQKLIAEQVATALEAIPFEDMVKFPETAGNFKVDGFSVGLGVGFNFNRNIELNEEGAAGEAVWKTTDTLEIFFTVGADGTIPVYTAVDIKLKANLKIGRQYSMVNTHQSLIKAIRGNIKKVLKMPFKKREIINNLKEEEGYGHGTFVGLHFAQGVEYSAAAMFGIGAEMYQKNKFLSRTYIEKKEGNQYDVSKAKSNEFTFGVATYVKVLGLLKLNFFKASVMLGKSKAKIFHFDLGDKSHNEAFAYAAFTSNFDKAEEASVPVSTEKVKFIETEWRLGFGIIASLGTTTRGSYVMNISPEGKIKRSYIYNSVHRRKVGVGEFKETLYSVNGRIEFSDKDYKNVTKRSLRMSYMIETEMAKPKMMAKRLKKINEWAGQKDFIVYDPFNNRVAKNHLGELILRFDVKFNEKGMACVMERVGCTVEGKHTRRVKWNLGYIKRSSKPIKRMRRAGRYLRRKLSALKPKYFKRVLDYIGPDKYDMEASLVGRSINFDNRILSQRPAAL